MACDEGDVEALGGVGADGLAVVLSSEGGAEAVGQRLGGEVGAADAVVVANELADDAAGCGHHGAPAGHGLDGGLRERFLQRRHGVEVGCRVGHRQQPWIGDGAGADGMNRRLGQRTFAHAEQGEVGKL